MFQEKRDEPDELPPPPPCGICGNPSSAGFWDAHLCAQHHALWTMEAPTLQAAELAHADAHPEDVAARGEYQHLAADQLDRRWVVLKRGVTEKLARGIAYAWLHEQRTKARAA